ncbi:hypothetical protein F5887DRAFT_1073367 [Amanita rubescens]|nr:hypothetical protein F5887DRAFT_1073367 [Amanita rubescens]
MVKFTFASACLIIASLSAAVSALPTTFMLYNITSFQTNYAILSDGTEKAGSDVSTLQASQGTPSTTTVLIHQFTDDVINTFGVIGRAGLYVTVKQNTSGTHLTWDTEPFKWLFTSTDPNAAFGGYDNYTINVPGMDLYWYDTTDQSAFIAIQSNTTETAQQLDFWIQTVDVK